MATEPPSHFTAFNVHAGVRPETRTKVIEILAGNANGCLQELGYTPGLIERIRHLEDANAQMVKMSDELHRGGKAWRAQAEAAKVKCDRFQLENVKLYEDNVKLVGDCETLRAQLAAAQNLCKIYEEARGKDGAELLQQYGALAGQYSEAVKELERYNINNNARVAAQSHPQASGSQPQPQPHASGSGSQPRGLRPIMVASQRRSSAPMPQMHSPHSPLGPHPQQISQTRSQPSMIQTLSQQRQSSAPLGWQAPWQATSPLALTPTPASAPPNLNAGHSYSSLIATGPPHYNRGGAHTGMPPVLSTPPMSALPLNLQNFASPASQRGPPRTASASSMGSHSHPTPVEVQSPALPSAAASVPPTPPEVREGEGVTPPEPPEMQEDVVLPDAPPEPQEAGTPPEAHEAITPPPHPVHRPDVMLESDALKRASPRLDGEDPRKQAHTLVVEVKMEVDSDAAQHQARLGGDEEEEDEEDDEDGPEVGYIEIGPDGLRTVADCVTAVFDPDQGMVCRFCMARYNADMRDGVPSEAPQPHEDASVEQLAAHCEAEHGYAWDMLRRN
ncbi:hypothetical protein DFH09DRAFT_1177148, partial [Mycena vulgaris]